MNFQEKVKALITELYSHTLEDNEHYNKISKKIVDLGMENINTTVDYVMNIATTDELMELSTFMCDLFEIEPHKELYDAFVFRYNKSNDAHFKKIIGVDIDWCSKYFN